MRNINRTIIVTVACAFSLLGLRVVLNRMSDFGSKRELAAVVSCKAPSAVSLEQYRTGIQVQINNRPLVSTLADVTKYQCGG